MEEERQGKESMPKRNILYAHKHIQICYYRCEDRAEMPQTKMMNEVKTAEILFEKFMVSSEKTFKKSLLQKK